MDEKTVDPSSGLEIRKTDNGPKECDLDAPQVSRLLTRDEIAAIIESAGEANGDS